MLALVFCLDAALYLGRGRVIADLHTVSGCNVVSTPAGFLQTHANASSYMSPKRMENAAQNSGVLSLMVALAF